VYGPELDATFAWRYATPRNELRIAPRLRSTWFPDEEDEDSNDQFLRLDWRGNTQRHTFGVLAEASRQAVVRSELPPADLDAPDLGEPDRIARDSTSYGLVAEWSNRLTPSTEIYAHAGAKRTEVDRPAVLGSGSLEETSWLAAFGARREPLAVCARDLAHAMDDLPARHAPQAIGVPAQVLHADERRAAKRVPARFPAKPRTRRREAHVRRGADFLSASCRKAAYRDRDRRPCAGARARSARESSRQPACRAPRGQAES
jgi:hypothetical protein